MAHHLHWSLDEILDLAHPVRARLLTAIPALYPPVGRAGPAV